MSIIRKYAGLPEVVIWYQTGSSFMYKLENWYYLRFSIIITCYCEWTLWNRRFMLCTTKQVQEHLENWLAICKLKTIIRTLYSVLERALLVHKTDVFRFLYFFMEKNAILILDAKYRYKNCFAEMLPDALAVEFRHTQGHTKCICKLVKWFSEILYVQKDVMEI